MKTRFFAILLCITLSLSLFSFAGQKSRGEQDYDRMVSAGKFFFEHFLDATPTGDPVKAWLVTMFEKDETLADQLINIMYQTWDPHSYYLKNQVHEEAFDFRNLMVGIGLGISETEAGTIAITNLTMGGPADTAGLKVGDIIVSVDGRDVTGYTLNMVIELIRGAADTSVTLKVRRGGGLYSFTAKRTVLPVSTVSATDHGGGVGYIKVTNFNGTDTFMDFTLTYEAFEERGLSSVILDLRDNLGGTLDCAANILNYILPEKGIPYLRLRYAAPTASKTAVSDGLGWVDNKLIILVNEYTASSSEILAGVGNTDPRQRLCANPLPHRPGPHCGHFTHGDFASEARKLQWSWSDTRPSHQTVRIRISDARTLPAGSYRRHQRHQECPCVGRASA